MSSDNSRELFDSAPDVFPDAGINPNVTQTAYRYSDLRSKLRQAAEERYRRRSSQQVIEPI